MFIVVKEGGRGTWGKEPSVSMPCILSFRGRGGAGVGFSRPRKERARKENDKRYRGGERGERSGNGAELAKVDPYNVFVCPF